MFQLTFDIPPAPVKIDLADPLYLAGSCFSDAIGHHLSASKFEVLANPFGTIYNPVSICRPFLSTLEAKRVVESQELFYHWDAHGKIAGSTIPGLQNEIKQATATHNKFLPKTRWLILTLGTSIVYELADGTIVANCHKRPGKEFSKRFLRQEEIVEAIEATRTKLLATQPDAQVILTVSPVRHLKDGLTQNNRSKAILLDTVHLLAEAYPEVHYFPSYEIVIDELRDYRFYSKDMIHPSEQAVSYIWEKFKKTYFSQSTLLVQEEWGKIRRSLLHRPFHTHTQAHHTFLRNTLQSLEELSSSLPLEEEIKILREQLDNFSG